MFENLAPGQIGICSRQQPKEMHYKALMELGYVPIIYIQKNKLDLSIPLFAQIKDTFPEMIGILVAVHFHQTYI